MAGKDPSHVKVCEVVGVVLPMNVPVPPSVETLLAELRDMIADMMVEERMILPEQRDSSRGELDKHFILERPIAELGWDSIQFPALLVRAEHRYGIDTSEVSVFDVFTVGDLVEELYALVEARR